MKLHALKKRSFSDLPMQTKKVNFIINNRKMLCINPDCNHKTFAETFECISHKAKKTKRLENEIINVSINVSSITASRILSENVTNVGKSTICNLFKKKGLQ
jgi:superfamily I DNA and RNA helicase